MFRCSCAKHFNSETGYKIHISRKCDNGLLKETLKTERMPALRIYDFLDTLTKKQSNTNLSDEDYFKSFFTLNLHQKSIRELPFYVVDNCSVFVKGLPKNLVEDNEDDFISWNWQKIDSWLFLTLLTDHLNKSIKHPLILDKSLKNNYIKYLKNIKYF